MPKPIDISGQTFGRLTAIRRVPTDNYRTKWLCRCKCGVEKEIRLSHLRSGRSRSCGCLNNEMAKERNSKHGLRKHPLYGVWKNMKNRCYYKKHDRYPRYGGRGIKVCEQWKNDFKNFFDWAVVNNENWRELV